MTSTTTCSYSEPVTLVSTGSNTAELHPFEVSTTSFSGAFAPTQTPGALQFQASECVTVSDVQLSTDPLIVALLAAALVLYTANYVRRIFYS